MSKGMAVSVEKNHGVTVLVLCGGRGERLRPLTESTPKPLIKVKGRPILSYILAHVEKHGIKDVVIAAGYRADDIQHYVESEYSDAGIRIVDSGDVDIIKRITDCSGFLKDRFILLYGDTLADVDISALMDYHESHDSHATVTLWPLRSAFGLADLDGEGNVTRFREKPTLDQWINIGYFCIESEAVKDMHKFATFAAYLEHAARAKKLKGFRHEGFHITINTIRELEEAEYNVELLGIQ